MESWKKKLFEEIYDQVTVKSKGICSTCKHFDGKTCAKKKISAGSAIKLSDCNDEWEVCGG